MKLILRFLLKYRLLFISLLLVSAIVAILEGFGIAIIFPILQGITGAASSNAPFPFNKISYIFENMPLRQRFQLISLLLFVIIILKNSFSYLSALLTVRLRVLVLKDSRIECANRLLHSGMGYFSKNRGSDFHVMAEHHTYFAAAGIVDTIGKMLSLFFTSGLLLIFVVLISWKLTLICTALVIFTSILVNRIHRMSIVVGESAVNSNYGFNRALSDIINGIKLVHLFNREKLVMDKFQKATERYNKDVYRLEKIIASVGPVFEIVGFGVLCLILFIVSFTISEGNSAETGMLLTFIIIVTRLTSPVKSINQNFGTIINRLPALRKLEQFLMSADQDSIKNGHTVFGGLRKDIGFCNVEFGYNPKGSLVFKDLSFNLPKGIRMGIVGASGAGKSTIVELLLRFYDPQKGRILVDGVDLRELDLNSWRRRIGVVSQDTFLFHDTIRNNIAFPNMEATQEQVELAAKRAYAHDFIANMPKGYDTYVGDRGVLLSGGEKQRIAIARAILLEPEILIFDEATSALDTESERIVQKALEEISQNRTVIAIAHRISTLSGFDKIIFINDESIVEEGTHQELLKKNGFYKKVVVMQLEALKI